jgi:hypothetical protein
MAQEHSPRLWLLLALAAAFVAVAGLWLGVTLPQGGSVSPLVTPAAPGTSPLPTPVLGDAATPSVPAWTSGRASPAWVALGIALALIVAFVILQRHRHSTR